MQILFIAVFATILPYWLLIFGLKRIDALAAAIVGMLDPLVASIAAYLLIGEILTLLNFIGVTIIIGSVIVLTMKDSKR